MILAQEQDVIDLIGLGSRTGSQSTAKNNLRLATSQIENHIGTSLALTERVDYFGCPRNVNAGANDIEGQAPAYILN